MGVASELRGQGGERGRAWPVVARAFHRLPVCGVDGGECSELFQQLKAKNCHVTVCVLCVCVRGSERGAMAGLLLDFLLNF